VAAYFPKDSIVRRVNNEPAVALAAGRALILQLAHPAVAAGVSDHSDFKSNPFQRLQGTLEAVFSIVYGSDELAAGVGRRVHWIHEFVVGPTYQANAAENLLWVHATLFDSALLAYTTFLGPLGPDDEEAYYQGMKRVAEPFGLAAADQPRTLADFRGYFDDEVAALQVSDVGRDLIGYIVRPQLPGRLHVPLAPALALHRVITIGTTPETLRRQIGFEWDAGDERRFRRWQRLLRGAFRVQPRVVRTAPNVVAVRYMLWLATRHVRAFDAAHPAERSTAAA